MQRVTITLDDDLLETLDSLSQRRGYNNRSEAIRDILRSALAQEATQQHGTQGFAVLSYVYEHDDVIAQRGVRHGHLQCLPKED